MSKEKIEEIVDFPVQDTFNEDNLSETVEVKDENKKD